MNAPDLKTVLRRLRHIRMSRGLGGGVLPELLRRLDSGEASIDEETAGQLGEVLQSLGLALEDMEREARSNLRVTSRTIGAAIRRGGR